MIRKVWTCPECKFRKFESLNALNVHMGKSHTVDYKISIVNNKVVFKSKNKSISSILEKIKKRGERVLISYCEGMKNLL